MSQEERYVIDHERAEWVVRTLIDAWRRKLPPFDHAEPVPARLPKGMEQGSLEHVSFLVAGLPWMRSRINSAEAYKRLANVYEKHAWIFDIKTLAADTDGPDGELDLEIRNIMLKYGLGRGVRDAIKFWLANAKKYVRFWGGNPLNIFWGTRDYHDLCGRFMNEKDNPDSPFGFLGFRHKMVSMFIYFLERAKVIDLWYPFPGPVDVHNHRILTVTECIVGRDGTYAGMPVDYYGISPHGREIYFKHCKTKDDVLDLADAMWYLSRDFCQQAQGNNLSRRINPLWEEEKVAAMREGRRPNKRFKHVLLPIPVIWTEEKIAVHDRTCGVCSLESVCKWTLPTAPNYGETRELLIIREPRPKPHMYQEVLLEVPRSLRARPARSEKPKVQTLADQAVLFE